MRFIVLGSGTAMPDPERGPAGFAVTVAEHTWLVDGGSGTIQRAARAGIDVLELAGGIYSHRHPDHSADLIALRFAFRVGARRAPYPIVAGEGFAEFLDAISAPWGDWLQGAEIAVHELALDRVVTTELEGLELKTAPAMHSAGALHLRFDADDASVVFSGDTGPSEHLVELARDVDLLVVECGSPPEHPLPSHMSEADVHDLLRRARPRQTWLTHFYPGSDPAGVVARLRADGFDVRHAEDGDVWLSAPGAPR